MCKDATLIQVSTIVRIVPPRQRQRDFCLAMGLFGGGRGWTILDDGDQELVYTSGYWAKAGLRIAAQRTLSQRVSYLGQTEIATGSGILHVRPLTSRQRRPADR